MHLTSAALRFLPAAILLTLASCGDEPGPAWLALEDLPGVELAPANSTPGISASDLQVDQSIPPTAWVETPLPGIVMALIRVEGSNVADPALVPHVLADAATGATESFRLRPWRPALMQAGDFVPGDFTVVAGDLFLCDPEGTLRARSLRYSAFIGRESETRFTLGKTTANGWLIRAGETVRVPLPELSGSYDLFLGAHAFGTEEGSGAARLAIRANGQQVHARDLTPSLLGDLSNERVALELDAATELVFENAGGGALLAIGHPRLVDRTWRSAQAAEPTRPDLVLFIADTFRADILEVNGGDPRWAPNLNAWTAEALNFSKARATAPWTLPSHTTMFTGLFPFQHGVTSQEKRIGGELVTLAEQLRASGYRTAAITDGLYVSQLYGLDQGFEFFYEHDIGMNYGDTTLPTIRDVLAADDGRPLFLFVQTYNVHTPYIVEADTRAAFPELFDPAVSPEHWIWPRFQARVDAWNADPTSLDEDQLASELRSMYLGNVHDFDKWFGRTLDAFEEAHMDNTVFMLTSDHGEAFMEHGHMFHSHSTYEEEVHVPLVIHGPGIKPGTNAAAASLIDLAPTLAHLADVPGATDWVGRSWLGPDGPTATFGTFASDHAGNPDENTFAVYHADRKVIGQTRTADKAGDVELAFDLAKDPLEREPLPYTGKEVPNFEALFRQWLTPVAASLDLQLSELHMLKLDAMGYVEQAVKELEASNARLGE